MPLEFSTSCTKTERAGISGDLHGSNGATVTNSKFAMVEVPEHRADVAVLETLCLQSTGEPRTAAVANDWPNLQEDGSALGLYASCQNRTSRSRSYSS